MKAEVNVLIYNMGILALASGVDNDAMTPISAKKFNVQFQFKEFELLHNKEPRQCCIKYVLNEDLRKR
jgi:hypothetical protein